MLLVRLTSVHSLGDRATEKKKKKEQKTRQKKTNQWARTTDKCNSPPPLHSSPPTNDEQQTTNKATSGRRPGDVLSKRGGIFSVAPRNRGCSIRQCPSFSTHHHAQTHETTTTTKEKEREANKTRSIVETLLTRTGRGKGGEIYTIYIYTTYIREKEGTRLCTARPIVWPPRRDEKLSACPNGTVARAILPSLASTDLKGRPQAPRRDARKRRSRSLSNTAHTVCPLIAAQTFCFSSPFPPSPPFPPESFACPLPSLSSSSLPPAEEGAPGLF